MCFGVGMLAFCLKQEKKKEKKELLAISVTQPTPHNGASDTITHVYTQVQWREFSPWFYVSTKNMIGCLISQVLGPLGFPKTLD